MRTTEESVLHITPEEREKVFEREGKPILYEINLTFPDFFYLFPFIRRIIKLMELPRPLTKKKIYIT